MSEFKTDAIGVKISEPTYHIINFYLDGQMFHRVFEPTFKRHVFIPVVSDWIEIERTKYIVKGREIEYFPDRIVATIHVSRVTN